MMGQLKEHLTLDCHLSDLSTESLRERGMISDPGDDLNYQRMIESLNDIS